MLVNNFIRFVFRPPMFCFAIISNLLVTFISREQRGLWYTPLAIAILALTIVYTKRRYGYKKVKEQS